MNEKVKFHHKQMNFAKLSKVYHCAAWLQIRVRIVGWPTNLYTVHMDLLSIIYFNINLSALQVIRFTVHIFNWILMKMNPKSGVRHNTFMPPFPLYFGQNNFNPYFIFMENENWKLRKNAFNCSLHYISCHVIFKTLWKFKQTSPNVH